MGANEVSKISEGLKKIGIGGITAFKFSVIGKKANLDSPKIFNAAPSEEFNSIESTLLSINSDAVLFSHPVLCELIIFRKTCLLLILPTGSLPTVTTRPSTYICGPIARKVATCGRSVSGEIDKDGRLNI